MKQKTMILIILAVVCGLGASFMTSKLLAEREKAEETVKVLVAKRNLDTGLLIKKPEDFFDEADVPKDKAPKLALTKFEEAKGRQLKITRRPGDTITQDDLFDQNSPTISLPAGHRAVGIRLSSEGQASGFACTPHSRVDIACAVRCNNDKNCGSTIILQNVLVLASGQATIRDETGKPMPCDVVTVALTPEDALKLDAARGKGSLSLLLRGFGDTAIVKVTRQTENDALNPSTKFAGRDDDDGTQKVSTSMADLPVPPPSAAPPPMVKIDQAPKDVVQIVVNGPKRDKVTSTLNEYGLYEQSWESLSGGSAAPPPAPEKAADDSKRVPRSKRFPF